MTRKKTEKTEDPKPTPNLRGAGESQAEPTPKGKIAVVEAMQALGFLEKVCVTCGTTKKANRCDVCGTQEHDE